jgi:hypothetical protein
MAISTFSELKTAIATWALRSGDSDFVTRTADCIALAEGRINRELGALETDTTLTGTVGSRRITTGLTIEEPIALWLAQTGYDEERITIQPDGSFPYEATSGKPSVAALDEGGTYLDFNRPLDTAYPFRFRYRGRITLSDAAPTNWLLTNHPDVYLAAAMMWGAGYQEDWQNGSVWKGMLEEGIPQIKNILQRKQQGTLSIDPVFVVSGHSAYNINTDQ